MFHIYPLLNPYLFTIYSQFIHYLFPIYSPFIHYLFPIHSLFIHYSFTVYSPLLPLKRREQSPCGRWLCSHSEISCHTKDLKSFKENPHQVLLVTSDLFAREMLGHNSQVPLGRAQVGQPCPATSPSSAQSQRKLLPSL